MVDLKVSPDLRLPIDLATETTGILAKKGAGKSNAAVVMAEEMWDAGVPWVAIDPKGDWWGLRSSADGKGPGLSLPVFGGRHGDLPLDPTSGAVIADIVLGEEGRGYLSAILDVSQFTLSDQRRFLLAFGERLFRQKDEEGVLHLFLEEAHEYLPQRVDRDQTRLVSTWQRIVKQGRFKGLGVTVVSQRSAALNKDVLTQIDSLVVLRTLSPQDRAVVKSWVDTHAEATEVLDSLPSLANGEAWLWSPERFGEPLRFRFRQRRTFDSGATPKVGQSRRVPATLADVDVAEIKEQMAEAVDKAKAEDPKELRRKIKALERQLREVQSSTPEPVVEQVEVPVLDESTTTRLKALVELVDDVRAVREEVVAVLEKWGNGRPTPTKAPSHPPVQPPAQRRRSEEPHNEDAVRLDRSQRAILTVLAQYGPRTPGQLALQTGYSPKASTIGVALSKLRRAGFVAEGQPVAVTQEGLAALGPYEPLPEGPALLDYWRTKLGGGAERKILDVLVERYPESVDREQLAELTGYSPTASTIGVALSKLRKLELVDGYAASADFMEMIQP